MLATGVLDLCLASDIVLFPVAGLELFRGVVVVVPVLEGATLPLLVTFLVVPLPSAPPVPAAGLVFFSSS